MSVSILQLITQADFVVQSIMFALMTASMWSWSIALDKAWRFRVLKKRCDHFEDMFEGTITIEEIYKHSRERDNHPLAKVFLACLHEWKTTNLKQIMAAPNSAEKIAALKERMSAAMSVASNRSLQGLESGLNFLAMVGSSAPFVGLLGTVWGIMNSFQGIAVSKNTSLASVAPGIAEALLATAFGLFAAIPAVLFYNIFSAKVNAFGDRIDNFSTQLLNAISKEIDK